jgi:hypothetical protein
MSQFQRRYTDRQKRAVAVAQLDGGMSAQQALDALNAGTLTDSNGPIPAPPDPMPKSTAHDCKRRLRQEREARSTGLERASADDARAEMNRRLTFAADRLTRRVQTAARNGTAPEKLAALLAKSARAVAEVHRATAEPAPPPSRRLPAAGTGREVPEPEPASPLDAIAADIERDDRREARGAASTSEVHGAPRAYVEGADHDPLPSGESEGTSASAQRAYEEHSEGERRAESQRLAVDRTGTSEAGHNGALGH